MGLGVVVVAAELVGAATGSQCRDIKNELHVDDTGRVTHAQLL